MNLKRKLVYSLFMVIITLSILVFVVFAWFLVAEKTDPIIVSTGSLRTACALYYGVDSDFDGELDDGSYFEITEAGIEFTDVIPGQIYTYKMVIENLGSVDGFLTITINDIIATHADMYHGFTVSFLDPEAKEMNLVNGDLTLFSDFVLATSTTYEFKFLIKVNNTISSELKFETLIITNFIVRLVQVH